MTPLCIRKWLEEPNGIIVFQDFVLRAKPTQKMVGVNSQNKDAHLWGFGGLPLVPVTGGSDLAQCYQKVCAGQMLPPGSPP